MHLLSNSHIAELDSYFFGSVSLYACNRFILLNSRRVLLFIISLNAYTVVAAATLTAPHSTSIDFKIEKREHFYHLSNTLTMRIFSCQQCVLRKHRMYCLNGVHARYFQL